MEKPGVIPVDVRNLRDRPRLFTGRTIILFSVEADRAIVAPLDDVPGNAGEGQTGAAGHGRGFREGEKPSLAE